MLATISPNLRMIIVQFLLKRADVPSVVQLKRPSGTPPVTPAPGKEVLPSTEQTSLLEFFLDLNATQTYQLVDAWFDYTERLDDKRKVRFIFCHNDHIRHGELHPEFVARCDMLVDSFIYLLSNNLWATQGYLNPYVEPNGTSTGERVLMLNCAGRVSASNTDGSNFMVWTNKEKDSITHKRLGKKVPIVNISPRLIVKDDQIILAEPLVKRDTPSHSSIVKAVEDEQPKQRLLYCHETSCWMEEEEI